MSYSTSTFPYDAVAYIVLSLSDGKNYQGSGAIIGPHTILTASHLLWDSTDGASVTKVTIYPGYNTGGTALTTDWAVHYNPINDSNDQQSQAASQSDFAIIDTAANLSAYGAFTLSANYTTGVVHATGYPGTAAGAQDDQTGWVTKDSAYNVLDYNTISLSPGASGGPIWEDSASSTGSTSSIVGIVSTSNWGVQLTNADIATVQAWENQDGVASSSPVYYFSAPSHMSAPTTGTYQVDGSGTAAVETLVFSGSLAQYAVTEASPSSVTVAPLSGSAFNATLVNLQQAQFSDYTLVFDLHSAEDKTVYELYQAAYDRVPDNAGFRYWAQQGDLTNMSALKLADSFLAAPEFAQKYGANPTNAAFVTELYANVLGRQPDAAGLAYWEAQANAGVAHDQLLVSFATSTENVQLVAAHTANGYWTT